MLRVEAWVCSKSSFGANGTGGRSRYDTLLIELRKIKDGSKREDGTGNATRALVTVDCLHRDGRYTPDDG